MVEREREQPVPVSMGSPWFKVIEGRDFLCTLARFPEGASLPPHVHDRPTFAVILRGGFDLDFTSPAIRRGRLRCTPGTVFVEPAGEKHSNDVGSRGAEAVVFQPDLTGSDMWAPFGPFLEDIQHFDHGGLALDARRLAREVLREDDLSPLATEALALQMLVEAGRRPLVRRETGGRPAWLDRVDEFVHECFREGLRIADVAAVAEVHPSHVAAVFRRTYGVPLGTYLRRLRVEWCRDQLTRSDQSISAVAYAAGFADQSHLTREFRRWVGTTPAEYRATRPAPGTRARPGHGADRDALT